MQSARVSADTTELGLRPFSGCKNLSAPPGALYGKLPDADSEPLGNSVGLSTKYPFSFIPENRPFLMEFTPFSGCKNLSDLEFTDSAYFTVADGIIYGIEQDENKTNTVASLSISAKHLSGILVTLEVDKSIEAIISKRLAGISKH